MKHLTAILFFILSITAAGQSKIVECFTPVCDSLAVLLSEHSGVEGPLKLKAVMKRKNSLDFYFNEYLGDFPWNKEDIRWFRKILKESFPKKYSGYRLGEIYSRRVDLNKLAMPELTYDGRPAENKHRIRKPADSRLIVNRLDGYQAPEGLSGRHIALWQSHGRYFDQTSGQWTWQRPCLFQTCEDMFTQGFVLPYLVPMLENAGAYVLMPRERDIQRNEVIADNDPTCGARGTAQYAETGRWTDAGTGFADTKPVYVDCENPFKSGSARQTPCVNTSAEATSTIQWIPDIPEKGEYAVYVSYKTLPNSTSAAHYTVFHRGGKSEFAVNQRMGGGTWIYLGTFEFDKGTSGHVTLDNRVPKGYRFEVGATVTADAVKFGGGMGNIARGLQVSPDDSLAITAEPCISGLPRSAEAARYWLQWAGTDTTIFYQNSGRNDYKDDFMSRGDWVEWMSRGSRVNPSAGGGLGIPIDLALGFHTDAGVTPNDSLVGTLAIYTQKSEGKTSLPSKEDRLTSRMYADIIQTQIVRDLKADYDTLWARRGIWDRGYRESRTPPCPAMLLELLSHQNFADMKQGLDPSFRFTASRSVYKGILKYLSNRYGCTYTVQPLPVHNIAVEFADTGKITVSWNPTDDPLEPTAKAEEYIVYKRIGNGAFDNGTLIKGGKCNFTDEITPGTVVSFKVAACNAGGQSFPSEIVSIGIPEKRKSDTPVLIINNFDRVSAPAWFDSGERAGFDNRLDSGVPHHRDITFVGEMYNFRRGDEWLSNERPGFGASYSDMAAEIVAGNTFDYASVHGNAILEAGYPFYSCSNERFASDSLISSKAWSIDLVCGKQVTTPVGNKYKYEIFPAEIQKAINRFVSKGGNILVSGAYIGTDLQESIYPIKRHGDTNSTHEFAEKTLGYKLITNQASRKGLVIPVINKAIRNLEQIKFATKQNPYTYCVESPDGIAPASVAGHIIYRYKDSGIAAGVAHDGKGYKCVSLGFPIEILEETDMINNVILTTLEYFEQ